MALQTPERSLDEIELGKNLSGKYMTLFWFSLALFGLITASIWSYIQTYQFFHSKESNLLIAHGLSLAIQYGQNPAFWLLATYWKFATQTKRQISQIQRNISWDKLDSHAKASIEKKTDVLKRTYASMVVWTIVFIVTCGVDMGTNIQQIKELNLDSGLEKTVWWTLAISVVFFEEITMAIIGIFFTVINDIRDASGLPRWALLDVFARKNPTTPRTYPGDPQEFRRRIKPSELIKGIRPASSINKRTPTNLVSPRPAPPITTVSRRQDQGRPDLTYTPIGGDPPDPY